MTSSPKGVVGLSCVRMAALAISPSAPPTSGRRLPRLPTSRPEIGATISTTPAIGSV